MPLLAGTRLGPYDITALIGAGGMGEVYRAHDSKLNRDVAIKILPDPTAVDIERRERFEREARAIAALNHPNIVTIYSVEEVDQRSIITMELVEGRSLAEIIPEHGLALDHMLTIAIAVADALAAAHQEGITHRDLKPANIMLGAGKHAGRIKVLDFGLAKLTAAPGERAGVSQLPTGSITGEGRILGTVAYMSPEQAQGLPVDHRSDIFSLGVMLYELVTGRRPFEGASTVSILSSILRDTPPPVAELRSDVPPDLARIIRRCLAKEPVKRYQTALDVRNELEDAKEALNRGASPLSSSADRPTPGPTETPTPSQPPNRTRLVAAAIGLIAAAGAVLYLGPRLWSRISDSSATGLPTGLVVSERQITTNTADNGINDAAISPDGKYIVYADLSTLRVRLIQTGETRTLPVPDGYCFVCASFSWSPDGTRILTAGPSGPGQKRGIWSISTLTGDLRQIADEGDDAQFSPDGSRIAVLRADGIWFMGPEGEHPTVWLKSPEGFTIAFPRWSPDGRWLAYYKRNIQQNDVVVEARSVADGSTHLVAGPGRIENILWAGDSMFYVEHLLVDRHDVWSIRVDSAALRVGPPVRVLRVDGPLPGGLTGSRDGKRLVIVKNVMQSDIYVGQLAAGGRRLDGERQLTSNTRFDWPSQWTRDSKQLLLFSNRDGTDDVFVQAMGSDNAVRLVSGKNARSPHYNPDGRWLLYTVWAEPEVGRGNPAVKLMRLPVAGGSAEAVLDAKNPAGSPPATFLGWGNAFPDFSCPSSPPAQCVIAEADKGTLSFSTFDPDTGMKRAIAAAKAPPNRVFWDLAQDGSRITYVKWDWDKESPVTLVSVATGETQEIQLKGWTSLGPIAWSADGQSLFVVSARRDGSELLHVDLTGSITTMREEKGQWIVKPRPSPDGRWLAYARTTSGGNAWLIER